MQLKNNSSQMATPVGSEMISKKISEGAEKTNSRSSSACIYRVGRELRALKRSAYTPHLVSIGPFHSKDEYLTRRSGDIKLSYVKSLFDRIRSSENTGNESDIVEQCLKEMKGLVEKARKCYAEEVDGADELNGEIAAELTGEMMLIDGCFILEFLYRKCYWYAEDEKISNTRDQEDQQINKTKHQKDQKISNTNQSECKKSDDPIFGSVPTRLTVQDDLLLLENQLPFFVLQSLYDLTLKRLPKPRLLGEYVNQIIPNLDPLSNCESNHTANSKNNPTESGSLTECRLTLVPDNAMHILDLIHKKYRPSDDHLNSAPHEKDHHHHHHHHHHHKKINTCSKFMHSASDLDYAGVKFEAPTREPDNSIFKVSFREVKKGPFHLFHRARFQIPTLCIDDSTERLLRNLIAFEQCRPGVECYVTSYAFLMDRLINTAKDVEVLQKAEVIRNYLRANEEASDIFNKLCQEVELGGFSYAHTCEEAARYSERLWPEFMAYVRYTYFSKPWTFLAFFIAFIGFGASLGNFILNLCRNPSNK